MLKSHSGLKKRVKITAGGVKRGHSCRHIRRTQSQNRRRIKRKTTMLDNTQHKLLKKFFQGKI